MSVISCCCFSKEIKIISFSLFIFIIIHVVSKEKWIQCYSVINTCLYSNPFFPGADKSSPAPAAASAANCVKCDQTAGAASHSCPIPDRQPALPPPCRSVTSLTGSNHVTLNGFIMNLILRTFMCKTMIFKSHRPVKSKGFYEQY